MEEQLISFETAKLLKESGHYFRSELFYGTNGVLRTKAEWLAFDGIKKEDIIYALTQTLLQKVLREKYKIEVACIPAYDSILSKVPNLLEGEYFGDSEIFNYCCFVNDNRETAVGNEIDDYVCYHDTYEHALEIGLYEGLRILNYLN